MMISQRAKSTLRFAARFAAMSLTFILLGLPFAVFVYYSSFERYGAGHAVPEGQTVAWTKNAESREFVMLTRFAVLSAAALFGALGATVSAASRKSASEASQPPRFLAAQWIGAVFACVLLLIFAGGFIRGGLFPESSLDSGFFGVIYLHVEFAKLLVWSFVAGFSERLVPQLLESLTRRLRAAPQDESQTKP